MGLHPFDCWIGPGNEIEVAGRRISKGLVYVGDNLLAADNQYLTEPALIDPSLPVASTASTANPPPHYWPSYEALSPEHRGAFLDWLSGPRLSGEAAQTLLFLYFYGLERRLISDPAVDPGAAPERSALVAELKRLGAEASDEESHEAFAACAGSLLEFLDAQDFLRDGHELDPPRERKGWQVPMALRLMIGEIAAAGLPLPCELAVSWILTSPEAYLRTPAQRCPREFAQLFEIRYRERFGEGLRLPRGSGLQLVYRPASQGLREVGVATDLPDVADSSRLVEPLRGLGRDCCGELDAYSRWLGRNPDRAGDFRAAATLPGPLLDSVESGELDSLRSLLGKASSTHEPWIVDADELIDLWSPEAEKLPKKDGVALLQLIERLGYGVEPDPRFGGPALARGKKAVLFKAPEGSPRAPSPAYAAATLLLHLLTSVAAADGHVGPEEERELESHIHGAADLFDGERERLRAHASWIAASETRFSGLKKKLEQLDERRRGALGRSVVAIAIADGKVDPEEVKTLGKVFKLLGLDPDSVYAELHAASAGDAAGPVVVREGTGAPEGHAIPPEGVDPARGLNRDLIDRKIEETATVSSLLSDIFEEPEAEVDTAPRQNGDSGETSPGGLNEAQVKFASDLAQRQAWPRSEVEALAASYQLMVDGALEAINDTAFERCDAPLAEGDDPIEIDQEIAKEILG